MAAPIILPTTVVGSYSQPNWLVDRGNLTKRLPPRVRAKEIWRVAPEFLEEAQDDATLIAIHDMERAGVDIITDGEMRRESYSNRFATALDGVDQDTPGTAMDRAGKPTSVPRIIGRIRRRGPVEVRDVEFLRKNTDRMIKITLPGPFTMIQQAENLYYKDEHELVMDYADAVNAELKDLKAAGADIVQIDEPYLQARVENARRIALEAIARALDGVPGKRALHTCFGYAAIVHQRPTEGYPFLAELDGCAADQISIESAQPRLPPEALDVLPHKDVILGVLDLNDMTVESPETVAKRIRAALTHVPAERLVIAPDCGMKYLPRAIAFGKLKAMVDGTRIVRAELGLA